MEDFYLIPITKMPFVNALYAPGIQDHLERILGEYPDVVIDSFQAPSGVEFDYHFHLVIDRDVQLQRLQNRESTPLSVLMTRLAYQDNLAVPPGAIVLQS